VFLADGLGGEALGSALAVGVVTGGWGLVAVGLIGGVAGGAVGEHLAARLLFSQDSEAAPRGLARHGYIARASLTKRLQAR